MKQFFNFFTIWFSIILSINMIAQSNKFIRSKQDKVTIILPEVTVKRDTIFVNENSGSLESIGSTAPAIYFKTMLDYIQFLSKNFNRDFSNYETKGDLLVSFIIDKDGSITYIKILKKNSRDADLEVIRVISRMKKWKPASTKKQNLRTLSHVIFHFDIEALPREKQDRYISKKDNEKMK